jgi:hypothetical protein
VPARRWAALRRGHTPTGDRLTASATRSRGWLPWAILALAGAFVVAVLIAVGAAGDVLAWLGGAWNWVTGNALGMTVLVALVVALVVYTIRRARLWHLARMPGPVEVAAFEYAGGEQKDESRLRELAADFSRRLADVQMYTMSSVPGAIPSSAFLQTLRTTRLNPKRPLETLVDIAAIAWPTHAYEVRVTLLHDAVEVEPPPLRAGCRVIVELTELVPRRTSHATLLGPDWNTVVDTAANHVAARIIPRTRRCRHTPWAGWAGEELPLEVFMAYQHANALVNERRYDEALAQYFRALEGDPDNREIRYAVGLTQEKLSLHLDALLTYYRLLKRGSTAPRRLPWNRRRLPGRKATDRLTMLVRYRFAVRLGFSERLARQWLSTGRHISDRAHPGVEGAVGWSLRDAERRDLRRQLRAILSARYSRLRRPEVLTDVLGLLDGDARACGVTVITQARKVVAAVDKLAAREAETDKLERNAGPKPPSAALSAEQAARTEVTKCLRKLRGAEPPVTNEAPMPLDDLELAQRFAEDLHRARSTAVEALRAVRRGRRRGRVQERLAGIESPTLEALLVAMLPEVLSRWRLRRLQLRLRAWRRRSRVSIGGALRNAADAVGHDVPAPTPDALTAAAIAALAKTPPAALRRWARPLTWLLGETAGPVLLECVLKNLLAEPRKNVAGDPPQPRELVLRELFQIFDEDEADRIVRDTRFTVVRWTGSGLTRTALDLLKPWARRRRARAMADRGITPVLELPRSVRLRLALIPDWARQWRAGSTRDWSVRASTLSGLSHYLRLRLWLSRRFPDHYNATCVHAVLLRPPATKNAAAIDLDVAQLETRAVKHLRKALSRAAPTHLQAWKPWVLGEDPDLTGLRHRSSFLVFEEEHFPSAARRPAPRPQEVHRLQQSRYVARVLVEAARRFETEWHRRGESGAPSDIHLVQNWWRKELAAWKWVRRFAINHRHWQTRAEAVQTLHEFALDHGQPAFAVRLRAYAERPLRPGKGQSVDRALVDVVNCTDDQFHALAALLGAPATLDAEPAESPSTRHVFDRHHDNGFEPPLTWSRYLRLLDRQGRRLDRSTLRALCESRAAAWEALAAWFDAPMEDKAVVAAAHDEFKLVTETLRSPEQHLPAREIRQFKPEVSQTSNGHAGQTAGEPAS